MDEQEMSNLVMDLLFHDDEECGTVSQIKKVHTFGEAGILYNTGLVVTMQDDSEFQITIVKSK